MTPDAIREQIEAAIVDLIKAKVEAEEMTEERAQEIANRVLEVLKPGMPMEELYRAIAHLDDGNLTEVSHIIAPYLRDYENGVTKPAADQVAALIHAGRYKDAQNLAERVIKQDVKLVWSGTSKTP
jgi:hypothetical protein